MSAAARRSVYIGEESERQINYARASGCHCREAFLLPETMLENIFDHIERINPGAIIVDLFRPSSLRI